MNSLLQETLFKRYSIFFVHTKDRTSDNYVLPIRFGIECHDGWFTILDTLMSIIKHHCHYHNVEPIFVNQIKEKFGVLCFYYSGGDEYISGLVSMATYLSSKTCEYCGTTSNVGKTEGWISIMCKDCHSIEPRRKNLKWNPSNNNRLLKLVRINKIINGLGKRT